MTGDVHVLPVDDLVPHEEDRGCVCHPSVALPCDECEDGCWKCDDGMVSVPTEHPESALVMHQAFDGRK